MSRILGHLFKSRAAALAELNPILAELRQLAQASGTMQLARMLDSQPDPFRDIRNALNGRSGAEPFDMFDGIVAMRLSLIAPRIETFAKTTFADDVAQRILGAMAAGPTVEAASRLQRTLHELETVALQLPHYSEPQTAKPVAGVSATFLAAGPVATKHVFITYSRRDKAWLKRLQIHLKPLTRSKQIDVWDDTKLAAGTDWKSEISAALARAGIAILLVSADFLASDFICENELPPILEKAQNGGTRILPIIVAPSLYEHHPQLSRFQAVNAPSRPLSGLSPHEAEEILALVGKVVSEL